MADKQNITVDPAEKSIYEIEASIASRLPPLSKDEINKLNEKTDKDSERRRRWREKYSNNQYDKINVSL